MFHNKKENDKLENQRVKKKQREDRNAAKAVAKAKEEHEKRMRRAEKAALAATKKAQPPSKKRSNEDMDIAPEIYAPPLKRSRTPPPFSTAPSHHLGDMFGGSLFGYP
jgi:septal ring factor EnvC (AmiA/AmiB activator)